MEKVFKALGDRTRLEILLLIALNPDICLCHIEECFHLSNSTLSRHLKELESVNLVAANKIGKWKHYQLSSFGYTLVELIEKIDNENLYNQVKAKSLILDKKPQC
jgi:ArsR family transcriptional regulator